MMRMRFGRAAGEDGAKTTKAERSRIRAFTTTKVARIDFGEGRGKLEPQPGGVVAARVENCAEGRHRVTECLEACKLAQS
jgi:hypothetical protein